MRYLLIALILVGMGVMSVSAQTTETVKVTPGKIARGVKSKVKIKFLEVVEDSRCPEGVACVWAGNAKVKAEVSYKGTKKIIEVNTGVGRRGDAVDVWSIDLTTLTPRPTKDGKLDAASYVAEFTITRLHR